MNDRRPAGATRAGNRTRLTALLRHLIARPGPDEGSGLALFLTPTSVLVQPPAMPDRLRPAGVASGRSARPRNHGVVRPPRRAGRRAIVCLIVGTLVAGPGCIHQSVDYSLKDVSPVAATPFAGRTLAVREFEDARPPQPTRSLSERTGGKFVPEEFRYGRRWLYNGNEHYTNKRVAPGVTRMVVMHLAATKLFKEVKLSGKDPPGSDLLIEGKIADFWGGKERSDTAEGIRTTSMFFGAVGGLVGALMTTQVKTEYRGKTMLIDLKLSEVRTGKALWQGSVEGEVSGKSMADTEGLTAYRHANDSLKEAMKSLVEKIQESVTEGAGGAKTHSPEESGSPQPDEPSASEGTGSTGTP